MSIQLFKTAKMILNRHLVPDMVRVIINEITEYYIEQGLEKHQEKLKVLKIEYNNTWFVKDLYNPFWLLSRWINFANVNDRLLASDTSSFKYELVFNFITTKPTGSLPPNYKYSIGR